MVGRLVGQMRQMVGQMVGRMEDLTDHCRM